MKIQKDFEVNVSLTVLCLSLCVSLGSGCATTKTAQNPSPAAHAAASVPASSAAASSAHQETTDSVTLSSEGSVASTAFEISYRGTKVPNSSFDLPVEMNRAVEKWIDYFTGRGRERFEAYLERSEYFIPFLKPILKNAKAPEDLVYLAMIESGFNNNAKSHARAVGAWQFIAPTGRRYGLDINWWIDERRDVEKSTIAAVQYLKELNAMFGSWHLAAAGYNAGEAKIQRAIKKYHTSDFWEMCKGKYLKPETKNYVPKLFAAAIIGKNRKFFGFEESYTKIKHVSAALVAAKAEDDEAIEKLPDQLDADAKPVEEKAADLGTNPTDPTVEITKDSPADPAEEAMLAQDSVESMLRNMSNPIRTPHVNRKGEVNGDILTEIEVPSPADLFKVSSASGLSYLEFKSMNPELLRWVTPPTLRTYKVRIPLSRKESFMKKYFDASFKHEVTFLTYKARKGDNPKRIAQRFGISPEPVAEMNSVGSVNSSIMPGKLVQLPIPSDFVRSLASLKQLDLLDPVESKHRRHRRSSRHRRKQALNSSSVDDGQARFQSVQSKKRL